MITWRGGGGADGSSSLCAVAFRRYLGHSGLGPFLSPGPQWRRRPEPGKPPSLNGTCWESASPLSTEGQADHIPQQHKGSGSLGTAPGLAHNPPTPRS